ncbi:MAG: exodeoxyribonuclease III [Bacteroidetes bacterium]|nr:exodeoxyribonuclease III [Bacteroidota bacterium]
MKVVSYNVNGIRSAISKGLLEWMKETSPDMLCVQELKAMPEQIPIMEFEAIGYSPYLYSAKKKGYSGVGIFTKHQPDNVTYGMGIPEYDNEGRFIRLDFGDVSVISVYHPSGVSGDHRQDFKMQWLDDFFKYVHDLRKTRSKLIISGDFNICHRAIDIHDPVRNANSSGFLPEERDWMEKFFNSGFIDTFRYFNQMPHNYTWWSFRANSRSKNLGWRIDYNVVTENLSSNLVDAFISPDIVHSDHCPAGVVLNL